MMRIIFRSGLWLSFLDILFPGHCLACGSGLIERQEISYCGICLQSVRLIREPFCTLCGKPFDKAYGINHFCGYCLRKGWYFKQARAVGCYQPPITEAVKVFKYRGKMHGLATFTALSQLFFQQHPLEEPDLIVPVPLHIRRLRQRGFNQALILSQKIFSAYRGKINPHILERRHWSRPQTGLRGAERHRNVKNAFMVRGPENIYHKKILLVDDVLTTGATVNECARVLLKNKASEVSVFTFARVID